MSWKLTGCFAFLLLILGCAKPQLLNPLRHSSGGTTAAVSPTIPSVSVTSLSPAIGMGSGGGTAVISGTGFMSGAVAQIGGVNCVPTTYVSSTTLQCGVPAAAPTTSIQSASVTVVNVNTANGSLSGGYVYLGAPLFWLRADQGVTQSGGLVSAWADQSGTAGQDLTQPTPALQPAYVASAMNGQPVVRFTAANANYLANTTFASLNGLGAATHFVVFQNTDTAGNFDLIASANSALNVQVFSGGLYTYFDANNNGSVSYTGTSAVLVTSLFDGSQAANATRLRQWVNGLSQVLTYSSTVGTNFSSSNGIEVGEPYQAMYAYWDGDLAEVLSFGTALSAAQKKAVECYLAAKYGLAAAAVNDGC